MEAFPCDNPQVLPNVQDDRKLLGNPDGPQVICKKRTMPMKSCTTPSMRADSWRAPSGVKIGAGRAGSPPSSAASASSKAEGTRFKPL